MDDQPELIPTRPIEKELSKQFAIAHDLGTKNLALQAELEALRARVADLEMNELFTSNTMVVLKDTIKDCEAIITQRDAEIARLTPQATRELPTREGWYWHLFDHPQSRLGVVRVTFERSNGTERLRGYWQDAGCLWIDTLFDRGTWSRDPIPEMVIEKEVER